MAKTYDQEFNDLQSAIISADFEYKKQEMILNERPLFSKNQMDMLKEKLWYYLGIGFIIGSVFTCVVFKILV